MFAQTAKQPSTLSTAKERIMLALVHVTCETQNISHKEFFRSAYIQKFGKDIPQASLHEDVEDFEQRQIIPPYVVDYVVGMYGQQC